MLDATREPKAAKRPILVILRKDTSTPGRAGALLSRKGFPLDIRRPLLGDSLPLTLDEHAGVIAFGGPMSANDNDPRIKQEIDWLSVPLAEKRPYLGICLGAQMLVKNLGGHVTTADGGITEIGWYPLRPTPEGLGLFKNWPSMVYHHHSEGFDLPAGTTLLAEGDAFRHQAFRFEGHAWGVQFHPELTLAMMRRWVTKGAQERFRLPNARPGEEHLHGRLLYDKPLQSWLNILLDKVFTED